MACLTTTTTSIGPCTPDCINPLAYIMELAKLGTSQFTSFPESLDRLLDKGVVMPSCDFCCPTCGVYSIASVETQLKLLEGIGLTQGGAVVPASPNIYGANSSVPSQQDGPCCANIYASVETWLIYQVEIGNIFDDNSGPTENPNEDLVTCCNGFNECINDLICWITQNIPNPADVISRVLDDGIIEYGSLINGCDTNSQLCLIVDLLKEYAGYYYNKAELIDRIFDKGIAISCNPLTGEIVIASTETWLKYAEAIGWTQSAQVPALGQTTTTTTSI